MPVYGDSIAVAERQYGVPVHMHGVGLISVFSDVMKNSSLRTLAKVLGSCHRKLWVIDVPMTQSFFKVEYYAQKISVWIKNRFNV